MKMKKFLTLLIAVVMLASLCACGTPAFSADKLTDAQAYTKAAMDSYSLNTGYEFKSAKVMLTSDFAKDMAGKADIKIWDVSAVTAAVVVKIGKAVSDVGSTKSTSSDATADSASATSTQTEQTLIFLLDADKSIVYSDYSGVTSSDSTEAAAPAEDESATAQNSGEVATLRREQAQTELDEENYLEANKEDIGEFVAAYESKQATDKEYCYSEEYLNAIAANSKLQKYDSYERDIAALETKIAVLDASKDLSDSEVSAAKKLMNSDIELAEQKFELSKSLAATNRSIAALKAKSQTEIDAFAAKAEQKAFVQYAQGTLESVSEYEAAAGQWGDLHPNYAAYQNENLKYKKTYTSSSGSSGSSSYSHSSSSSSSSSSDGYDYDKGFGYTAPYEGESLRAAEKMTVNSSPYAVPVYHRLGFRDTDNEQTVNGLRFTPMERPAAAE